MALVAQIALGVIVAVLAIVVLWGAQAAWLLAKGWSADKAIGRSAGWTVGLLSAMITVLSIGFLQGGQVINELLGAIASAPIASTQLVTIILGLVGISTGRIGPVAFVAAAVTFALFTRVMTEVRA